MNVDSRTMERSDLESKVLPELQKIAESLGVEGHQRLRKGDLITAILDRADGHGGSPTPPPEGNGQPTRRPRGSSANAEGRRSGPRAEAPASEHGDSTETPGDG